MAEIVHLVMRHGYSVLFAAVFLRQIGLPVPANLFVIAAGALAAAGQFRLSPAIALAIAACVIADWVWYELGRLRGDRVLRFFYRFTRDPIVAERNAKRTFQRHGPPLLLVAKFVPGLDAVAPPMAGIARTSRVRFLSLEFVGAGLWTLANSGLGFLFSNNLDRAVRFAGKTGTVLAATLVVALCIYAVRQVVRGHGLDEANQPEMNPVDSPDGAQGFAP